MGRVVIFFWRRWRELGGIWFWRIEFSEWLVIVMRGWSFRGRVVIVFGRSVVVEF